MKKHKILLLIIGLLSFLILSDFIYYYRNDPKQFGKIYLYLALNESKKDNLDRAYFYLDKSAYFHLKDIKTAYGFLPYKVEININFVGLNPETKKEALTYLKAILPAVSSLNSTSMLAAVYYNLGLIAYKNRINKTAETLFLQAVNLEPDSGYLFLELADFYFYTGRLNKGKEVINKCLLFKSPKKQCQDYYNNNVTVELFLHMGIFKYAINSMR